MDEMRAFYRPLGEALRNTRIELNLTLEETLIRSELGLNKSSLVNIEKGRQQISIFQLYRLCKALRISPTHFLEQVFETPVNLDLGIFLSDGSERKKMIELINKY